MIAARCDVDDSVDHDGGAEHAVLPDAPATIDVAAGQTVRLRFRNEGNAVHEAVVGDAAFQDEHAAEMAGSNSSGGSMGHDGDEESDPVVVNRGRPARSPTPQRPRAHCSSDATNPDIGKRA